MALSLDPEGEISMVSYSFDNIKRKYGKQN